VSLSLLFVHSLQPDKSQYTLQRSSLNTRMLTRGSLIAVGVLLLLVLCTSVNATTNTEWETIPSLFRDKAVRVRSFPSLSPLSSLTQVSEQSSISQVCISVCLSSSWTLDLSWFVYCVLLSFLGTHCLVSMLSMRKLFVHCVLFLI
jgi:hypothetical protein